MLKQLTTPGGVKKMKVKSTRPLFFSLILVLAWGLLGGGDSSAAPKGTIAFVSSRNSRPPNDGFHTTIYLIEADGSNERKWLENPQMSFQKLSWSPDGKFVAFDMLNLGEGHIFVMDVRTGEQKNVTARWAAGAVAYVTPDWSRDGKWLALTCIQLPPDGASDVCIMDVAGNVLRNLTRLPGIIDNTPSWSPDSSRIAFATLRDGNTEIYAMDRSGRNPVNLTDHPAEDLAPAWSPDGRKIAFYSDRDGNSEIYVMNPDGTGVVNLTRHPKEDRLPAWSPDGRKIAFQSNRDGNNWNIYIMDANGGNQTQVTDHPGLDGAPTWVIPDSSLPVNPQGKLPTIWGHLKSGKQ